MSRGHVDAASPPPGRQAGDNLCGLQRAGIFCVGRITGGLLWFWQEEDDNEEEEEWDWRGVAMAWDSPMC